MSEITKRPYNGWNNYATFRVHNDILNGIAFEESVSIDDLREIVTNVVFRDRDAYFLLNDYANLFLNNVDWEELVETYNYDRKAKQSS
jgi:hypothetical protein